MYASVLNCASSASHDDDGKKVAKNKCWVYDMRNTEPGYDDFEGALLKCLLNGVAPFG